MTGRKRDLPRVQRAAGRCEAVRGICTYWPPSSEAESNSKQRRKSSVTGTAVRRDLPRQDPADMHRAAFTRAMGVVTREITAVSPVSQGLPCETGFFDERKTNHDGRK